MLPSTEQESSFHQVCLTHIRVRVCRCLAHFLQDVCTSCSGSLECDRAHFRPVRIQTSLAGKATETLTDTNRAAGIYQGLSGSIPFSLHTHKDTFIETFIDYHSEQTSMATKHSGALELHYRVTD